MHAHMIGQINETVRQACMHTDEKKNYLSGRNPTTKNEQTLAVRRQTTTKKLIWMKQKKLCCMTNQDCMGNTNLVRITNHEYKRNKILPYVE
jgi:hypothetical protein